MFIIKIDRKNDCEVNAAAVFKNSRLGDLSNSQIIGGLVMKDWVGLMRPNGPTQGYRMDFLSTLKLII